MKIKHNYSYMVNKELIDLGYAKMDVKALIFDKFFTEEQKSKNQIMHRTFSREKITEISNNRTIEFTEELNFLIDDISKSYSIYNKNETEFKNNWDLFLYDNAGWNQSKYYDFLRLDFNKKRSVEENMELLEDLIKIVELYDTEKIECTVQYVTRVNEEKLEKKSLELCEKLQGKTIELMGMKGKIKLIREGREFNEYGFFKSRARKKYYPMNGNKDLVLEYA